MKRSDTIAVLSDWEKDPKHLGSVYIKPTENKRTFGETCYVYFHFFCCCKYVELI